MDFFALKAMKITIFDGAKANWQSLFLLLSAGLTNSLGSKHLCRKIEAGIDKSLSVLQTERSASS